MTVKIHVQRTSEFKYHFLFYCLYILYIRTWSRSRHSAVRMKYLRSRALAIFYLSAHFFNTWQSAQHCVHLVLLHLWAKFLLYTPFLSTHLNYLNFNKMYSHANKKYMYVFFTFFSVLSRIVLHSSKFGGSLHST